MQVFRGESFLQNWQNFKLHINYDRLFFYNGRMNALAAAESKLGNLLFVFSIGFLSVGILIPLLNGQLADVGRVLNSPFGLIFFVGLLLFCYAQYLTRDRSIFSFRRTNKGLHELEKSIGGAQIKVNVEDYFSYSLTQKFDYIYHHNPQKFLADLANSVVTNKGVLQIFNRLGLNANQARQLAQVTTGINTRFDSHVGLFGHIFIKAIDLGSDNIDESVVALCLIETLWLEQLRQMNVHKSDIEGVNVWLKNQQRKARYREIWEYKSLLKPTNGMNRAYTSRYTPTLKEYGNDYTKAATLGQFTLSIGKEDQMRELLKTLQKDTGAAAIILGEPGVGKTMFLRHLGTRMVVEDVPKSLRDKRLVAFEHGRAYTNAARFEDYKIILQKIFDEVASTKDVILLLDNLDQMLDIRDTYKAELVNLIVGAVDKYGLQLIATATPAGYNKFIKPVPGLAAIFASLALPEPKPEVSLQILIDEAVRLEKKYGIGVQVPALKQIVQLAPKFSYERVMPDKGVDLLEEAILEARDKGLLMLTGDVVNDLISRKVGVNVGRISEDEAQVLIKLEERMHGRVIGQDQAISAVANALRRARAGLQKSGKPVASFLFFGPTGIGKTEVSKTLAEAYYGDEKLMIRLDMSEYQEESNLGRLIGELVQGRFTGGFLTEAVRQKPFSLVLIDEIEKANPKVLDLFLQLLDEGFITDGAGRKVDFSNTIIIATTNAGSREIAAQISTGKAYNDVYMTAQEALKQVFRVEFLNRFSKIVMFKPLTQIEIEQVAQIMLEKLDKQLQGQGYTLEYTQDSIRKLAQSGYDPVYGARQMQRIIQEQVEDKIAEAIVKGSLRPGGVFRL